MVEGGYAEIRPYWPDVLWHWWHRAIYWLGTLTAMGLGLQLVRVGVARVWGARGKPPGGPGAPGEPRERP